MSDTHTTPFEVNIAEQPDALRRLANATTPSLDLLTLRSWDRIVLTGWGPRTSPRYRPGGT